MTDLLQTLFQYICQHNANAHWIICGLILLAGLNVPISEDFLLLSAGAIASTSVEITPTYMYGLVLTACLIAGWEAYWIGRLLGPKISQWRWFKHVLSTEKIDKIKYYLEKFGVITFIVGRFIPGGVRNALFLSSGLTKMPFTLFMMRDLVGCLVASGVIFYLGYLFGANAESIFFYMQVYERFFIILFAILIMSALIVRQLRRHKPSIEVEIK